MAGGSPAHASGSLLNSRHSGRSPGRRRWIFPIAALLVAAAIILPPLVNINRYHRLIAESIGSAIGRPVHMSAVNLVVLPRPGFELSDFVVDEDPRFGAEPILTAPTVTASVRLVSLWKGRLEIARIQLDGPSLNLVRSAGGQWNFAQALLQASRTPNAPTAQRHSGSALRFPYIEASDARINLKFGQDKQPFCFLNADLSVWLAQPDEWQLRFEAQPVRTDLELNLADTGLLRIEGSLHRASALTAMPWSLRAEWSKAQLGQLTRLLVGADQGWRGDLDIEANITGSPQDAHIESRIAGSGIHRAEFEPDRLLTIDSTCDLEYRHASRTIEGLNCLSPVGPGQLALTGAIYDVSKAPRPVLSLDVRRVPVSAILLAARAVRRGFAPSVNADGEVNGTFSYGADPEVAGQQAPGGASPSAPIFAVGPSAGWRGQAAMKSLTIESAGLVHPLVLANVTLAAGDSESGGQVIGKSGRRSKARPQDLPANLAAGAKPLLTLSPVSIAQPRDPALSLSGGFSTAGFELRLVGAAPIARLVSLSRGFDLVPLSLGALGPLGSADIDLTLRGPWVLPLSERSPAEGSPAQRSIGEGFTGEPSTGDQPSGPRPTSFANASSASKISGSPGDAGDGTPQAAYGSLVLHKTQLATSFLAGPIEISLARGTFTADQIAWDDVSADYGPIHAEGSVALPLPCPTPDACVRHVDLRFDTLDAGALQSKLLGAQHGQLIEDMLSQLSERPRPWPAMEGSVQIGTLTLAALSMRNASAAVRAEGNRLVVDRLDARALGGVLHANGSIDAGGDAPLYSLDFDLTGADPAQVAALFHEDWGPRNPESRLQVSPEGQRERVENGFGETIASTSLKPAGGGAFGPPPPEAGGLKRGRQESEGRRAKRRPYQPARSGVLDLETHVEVAGYTIQQLVSSARGSFQWTWTGGGLNAGPEAPAILSHFGAWFAQGSIVDQELDLERSFLTGPGENAPQARKRRRQAEHAANGVDGAGIVSSRGEPGQQVRADDLGSANLGPTSLGSTNRGFANRGSAEPDGWPVSDAVLHLTGAISFTRELSLQAQTDPILPSTSLIGRGPAADPAARSETSPGGTAGDRPPHVAMPNSAAASLAAPAVPAPASSAALSTSAPATTSFEIVGNLQHPLVRPATAAAKAGPHPWPR